MKKITLAIILTATFHTPSFAINGEALKNFCNARDNFSCLTFVAGTLDGLKYGSGAGLRIGNKALADEFVRDKIDFRILYGFCSPREGISNGQMRAIVTKYLNDHPEELHRSGGFLVMQAVVKAFPCKF